MKQRARIYYTEAQKALMWEHWKKGESLQQIAQLFDRNHSSVQRILAESGGIRPAERQRSRLALTLAERKRYHVRSLLVNRSVGLLKHLDEHRPLLAVRSVAMVARRAIELAVPTRLLGSEPIVLSVANW